MNRFKTKPRLLLVFALMFSVASGCATPKKKTAAGAGIGGAAGAGVGAIVGGGKGALIGAGIGAVMGGIVGNRMDAQAAELEKVAETKKTDQGILLSLKGDITFASGSSNLTPAATTQITQIAAVIAKYPTDHITITGHTDSTGSHVTNSELSTYRARAVETVLIGNGVKPEQVTTRGMGESQPISSNKTAAGRAKNRRVELMISDVEASKPAETPKQ